MVSKGLEQCFKFLLHEGDPVKGNVDDYNTSKYVASEDRHGISVAGSTNVTIEGLTVDGSGGGNPKRSSFCVGFRGLTNLGSSCAS